MLFVDNLKLHRQVSKVCRFLQLSQVSESEGSGTDRVRSAATVEPAYVLTILFCRKFDLTDVLVAATSTSDPKVGLAN